MLKEKFKVKYLLILISSFLVLFGLGVGYKIMRWKAYIWIPTYFSNKFHKQDVKNQREIHILFLLCDHFEPGWKKGDKKTQATRVDYWIKNYRSLISKHKDSDGYTLRHTWFYPFDERNEYVIERLNELVWDNLGEIEFHIHHGNDTSESIKKKLEDGLRWFNQFGAMLTAEEIPQRKMAFIHGMFALDNSCYEKKPGDYCGVNNELKVLKEYGCYADFTFPTMGNIAQPSKINSIYYALDTPEPKSYNKGIDVKVGGRFGGDLMIFQGPIELTPNRYLFEYGCLDVPPNKTRVDAWMRSNIHVKGRPEWIFVKAYVHSAVASKEKMFSKKTNEMFNYLESKYNSPPYKLHYVTAREAYNIVKAAEAGFTGNPNKFRDYLIKPPINTKIHSNAKYHLFSYNENFIKLKVLVKDKIVKLKFKEMPILNIEGSINSLIILKDIKGWRIAIEGEGNAEVISEEPILNGNLIFKKGSLYYYSIICQG